MRTIRNHEFVKNAQSLLEVIEQRRRLEKIEADLKKIFKLEFGGDEGVIVCGNVMLCLSTKNRTSLDRERLLEDQGLSFVQQYEKSTSYQQLDVRAC